MSKESNQEMTNNPTAVNKPNAWTNEPNFSLLQSNILYLMFFLGSFLCLGADMIVQKGKNGFISNNTQFFISILLLNIILWVDFNFKVFRKTRTESRSNSFCEELFQDSTNIMFCVIIAPVMWMTQGIRLDHL